MADDTVLVLGAYGLAGRAIVEDLLSQTPLRVVAAGRDLARLSKLPGHARLTTQALDVTDHSGLRRACEDASLVINAVGPFAQLGADTARVVIQSGRHYVDCANEQIHYRRLQALDGEARDRGLLLVTAAGAIPGWSTMLAAHLLERFPEATALDCCWAHLRLPDGETGVGSVMSGILEATQQSVALRAGAPTPVTVGRSRDVFDFPAPFGRRTVIEVPTIDALTIPERYPLQDLRTWFYFGELPSWLIGLIRFLRPDRRPPVYRFVKWAVSRINASETAKAIAAGVGPEGLLHVTARNGGRARVAYLVFRDGARATSRLPALIARDLLAGRWTRSGLATPLDLYGPDEILAQLGDSIVESHLASDPPQTTA